MSEILEFSPPIEVMFDYVDGQGDASRRHVMIFQVTVNDDRTLIDGRDLDIGQTRTFRLDRVECFIDGDGVCREPKEFLAPHLQSIHQSGTPKAVQPEPSTPKNRAATVAFWAIIAAIAAFCAIMAKETDIGVGLVGFVMLAGPLFLLRWIWRLWANRGRT